MSPEFTLMFWRGSFGLLAAQIAAVVVVAILAHRLARSAVWRRSIWQIALATAGLLTVAEWSGAGRAAMDWAGRQLAARRTVAAVNPPQMLAHPSPIPQYTPVVHLSRVSPESSAPSPGPVPTESVSEPLVMVPSVASLSEKVDKLPGAPAVWWPAWLWLIGFSALFLRFLLLNSIFLLFRFFRRIPVDAVLEVRVQSLAPRVGLKRGVRVVALRGLTGPVAFGVLRTTIGVPPDYSHDFTPAEQDAMLAHELAHLAAHDPAWSWLADLVCAVLWWHPLIWIARCQLRATSETAADEASALLQDGPETLAECLVNLGAKLASGPVYGGMGVAERGFRSALGQRVERLLKLRSGSWQPPRRWTSLATKSFALTGLLVIAIGCGAWMSPQSTQAGNVMGAVWRSLDVSAMSGLFIAQVDSPPSPARKPTQATATIQSAVPASISGFVRLPGAPPPETTVNLSQIELDVRGGKPMTTRHYVVGKDSGLANVVVYVKSGLQAQKYEIPSEPVVLEARGLEWHPYVVVARMGQKIKIRNLDQVMHNLHVTPRLNKEFNLAVPIQGRENEMAFPLPEVFIRMKGDVYPWMFAYVSVFDHPYFAVTDENGRFRFPQPLPPGTYEIEARHLKEGMVTKTITLGKERNQELDFTFATPSTISSREEIKVKPEQIQVDAIQPDGQAIDPPKVEDPQNRFYPAPNLKIVPGNGDEDLGSIPKSLSVYTNSRNAFKFRMNRDDRQKFYQTGRSLRFVVEYQESDGSPKLSVPVEFSAGPPNFRNRVSTDRGATNGNVIQQLTVADITRYALDQRTTPEPGKDRNNLNDLIQDAKRLLEDDKLDEADAKLRKAIKMDGSNQEAFYYLNLVRVARQNSSGAKTNVPAYRADSPNRQPSTNIVYSSKGRQKIKAKLDEIRIQEVFYDNLPLGEVIKSLRDESRKGDPDKVGINFLLMDELKAVTIKVNPALRDVTIADVLDVIMKVADKPIQYIIEDYGIIISSKLPDSPKSGTTKTNASNSGSVPNDTAAVTPESLITRSYKVNPQVFINGLTDSVAISGPEWGNPASKQVDKENLILPLESRKVFGFESPSRVTLDPTDLAAEYISLPNRNLRRNDIVLPLAAVTNSTLPLHQMVRQYFTKAGADLTPPQSVYFNDTHGVLMVRATAEDFAIIGPAIEKLNIEPPPRASASVAQRGATTGSPTPGAGDPAATSAPEPRAKTGVKQEQDAPKSLVTRTFKVDPNTFLRALERINGLEPGASTANRGGDSKSTPVNAAAATTGTNSALQLHELVRQYFTNAGVDLAAPKSVFFNDRNGLLMVRATLNDLEIIQQAIEILNSAPPQVTIEAKFAEVTESDGKALGFTWFLGMQNLPLRTNNVAPSKTNELAGNVTGILTGSQFRTVVKALEQRSGVDILTAPRVTALSGRPAQVSTMQAKSIITGIKSSKSPDGTVTSSPEVTAIPFGPVLDIVANVGADGYSIQMTITATVNEFLGYEKPDPKIMDSWGKVSKETIPLPVTRTRQVTTSATVWDGQTLVLGGLISETDSKIKRIKEKVPVLNDEPYLNRPRKNLVIFITPTIIDPAGNRVHPEESLKSQQTIPPQN